MIPSVGVVSVDSSVHAGCNEKNKSTFMLGCEKCVEFQSFSEELKRFLKSDFLVWRESRAGEELQGIPNDSPSQNRLGVQHGLLSHALNHSCYTVFNLFRRNK